MNKKWKLTVHHWEGQNIVETIAIGKTKSETIKNWFFQHYRGRIPDGACLPGRDLIQKQWIISS